MHEAFRRLNYACLTLVRKGDAKSHHSEILVIASFSRIQSDSRIDNRRSSKRSSVEIRDIGALLSDQEELIVIIVSEDKVP